MKLHYHPLSTYSRKAAIAVGLRGDAIELAPINAMGGDLKKDWYLQLNPFGKMPALELDDGTSVYESTSIVEYLEERGPRRLLPIGKERAARHFDRVADLYLLDPIGKYFWNKTDDVLANAKSRTAQAWGVIEKELADGRPFLCGDEITLADIGPAIAAHYAATEGLPVPAGIERYRARLEENSVFANSRDGAAPFVEKTLPMRQPKS